MNCKECQSEMANELFSQGVEDELAMSKSTEHLAGCVNCREEMTNLRRTMELLDAWKAPEPSLYFDQKMAVLLREEQAKGPAGWLEKMRERLLFNTGRQFRLALVGGLALMLVLGGGSYVGVSNFNHPVEVQASAAVNDLQILDRNDQAIRQMDQLLQDDDSGDGNVPAQPAS